MFFFPSGANRSGDLFSLPNQTKKRIFHIGLDDTDSSDGMCTTFLAYNLVKRLLKYKEAKLVDYPNLIRLNPNVPWKTRGNGALVLRIETTLSTNELFKECKAFIDRFATSEHANAGLVIHEGETVPEKVSEFSKRALCSILSVKEAKLLAQDFGMIFYARRSEQGLVGALAGIGNELKSDFTFELIAYRKDTVVKRKLDKEKIKEMSRLTYPLTFNSYDEENDRVLIMPHGPDPVFFGIRGETPAALRKALALLLPVENLLGYAIFRSNQGTGEHLENFLDLGKVKSYSSGRVIASVVSKPIIQIGGHVFFTLENKGGAILCACYEPTGKLRDVARALLIGDVIEVGGGVRKPSIRHPKVLNIEFIRPLTLAKSATYNNPLCVTCGVSMSSEGKGQGFQCQKCGKREHLLSKLEVIRPRGLVEGKLYLPDLKAHRHLTKPLQRYSTERARGLGEQQPVKYWLQAYA